MNTPVPLSDLPIFLEGLLRRLKPHRGIRWTAENYTSADQDGRVEAASLEEAEAVSSIIAPGRHAILLDIDVPAWLIESSTEGHSHLYVDVECAEEDYFAFLDACAKVGLLEAGYVSACKERGATSLRLPWIRKRTELDDLLNSGGDDL